MKKKDAYDDLVFTSGLFIFDLVITLGDLVIAVADPGNILSLIGDLAAMWGDASHIMMDYAIIQGNVAKASVFAEIDGILNTISIIINAISMLNVFAFGFSDLMDLVKGIVKADDKAILSLGAKIVSFAGSGKQVWQGFYNIIHSDDAYRAELNSLNHDSNAQLDYICAEVGASC